MIISRLNLGDNLIDIELDARRKKNIFCRRYNIQIFLYYSNIRALLIVGM